ncbi:unnamed protein product [Cladocopium goreaui]|uniref:Methyltransferase domain-containing protein n=1 Tax=Cladocopium goreaui TaxID=2562237 RepID=A0A9P1GE28_9DINO|nr:unnamed protein product [Cladocopium goreaui]
MRWWVASLGAVLGLNKEEDLLANQMEEVLNHVRSRGFQESDRRARLLQQDAVARLRRQLLEASLASPRPQASDRPRFACPPPGAGIPEMGYGTDIEEFHYQRHQMWAEEQDLCRRSFGLWTYGGKSSCAIRAEVIGSMAALVPGDLVLDVGSACGHMARWFYDWYGAKTLGVDFQPAATAFAEKYVTPFAPAQFCWLDVSSQLGDWLPNRSVKLATAISAARLYWTYHGIIGDLSDLPMKNVDLKSTSLFLENLCHRTKNLCRVTREMFRATAVGGHTWVAHNGVYQGKWDPKRVWGSQYWKCCFHGELRRKEAVLIEVPEDEIFQSGAEWESWFELVISCVGSWRIHPWCLHS